MNHVLLILSLRWTLFKNGLKSRRSVLELAAALFMAFMLGAVDISMAIGLAILSYVTYSRAVFVPLLSCILAGIMAIWQVMPLLTASFGEDVNSSRFRLYPLLSRELLAIDLFLGLFDPVSALAIPLAVGVFVGCALKSPASAGLGLAALIVFLVSNIALSRYIRRLIGGLLANRRRKEVIALIVFLLLFVPQMVIYFRPGRTASPAGSTRGAPDIQSLEERVRKLYVYLAWTPPGLLARDLGGEPREPPASTALSMLVALIFAAAFLRLSYKVVDDEYYGRASLWARLFKKRVATPGPPVYRPAAHAGAEGKGQAVRDRILSFAAIEGLAPWLSPASAAVFEKDLKYLFRSPRAILNFLGPMIGSIVFLLPRSPLLTGAVGSRYRLAGPLFYVLLISSQFLSNSFCLDWQGAKLYFMSPASGRTVLIGKNVASAVVICLQMTVIMVGFQLISGPLPLVSLINAFFVFIIALPVLLTIGNHLSVLYPRATDLSKIHGRSYSGLSALVSGVASLALFGVVAIGPVLGWITGSSLVQYLLFLAQAVMSISIYFLSLGRTGALLEGRAEAFMQSLLTPR